jgi:hypothetical protein
VGSRRWRTRPFKKEDVKDFAPFCQGHSRLPEINPILDHKNGSAVFAIELAASSLGLTIL